MTNHPLYYPESKPDLTKQTKIRSYSIDTHEKGTMQWSNFYAHLEQDGELIGHVRLELANPRMYQRALELMSTFAPKQPVSPL